MSEQDWQDRLIAEAATITLGPIATTEPIRLERLPKHLNFDEIIDVEVAERRFALARQGRAFLPVLAAWKREVVDLIANGQGDGLGDDASESFWALSGVAALGDILLEIGWIGGDNESDKAGEPDRDTLDAYAAEGDGHLGVQLGEIAIATLEVEHLTDEQRLARLETTTARIEQVLEVLEQEKFGVPNA